MKIFKYTLETDKINSIEMPKGAWITHCHEQNNKPCIWVMFENENVKETRNFIPVVTGVEIDTDLYVGTCHLDNGKFVIHIFEKV